MEVIEMNLVGFWKYKLAINKDCTICRNNIHDNSNINCNTIKDSEVITGECLHGFHKECILPWVKKNKLCPLCFKKWQAINN